MECAPREMLYLPSASALRQTFYGIAFKSRFVGYGSAAAEFLVLLNVYILMGKVGNCCSY